MADLILKHKPQLQSPWLVMAFDGWPNAGGVAIQAGLYLRNKLNAAKFAGINPEEFYSFFRLRPLSVIEDGLVKGIEFPANEFYAWKAPEGGRDLILLLGVEPHLHWQRYLKCLFQVARDFQVTRAIALGSTFDRIPHTLEPRISASVNEPGLLEEVKALEVRLTDYAGPCSFHTVMQEACKERQLPSVGLWGHVPFYVQAVGNPRVTHALLLRLTRLLGLEMDLGEIYQAGEQLQEMLNRFMAQKGELQDYVRQMEEEATAEEAQRHLSQSQGADRLVKEVEDFLRREQHRRQGED